MRQAKVVPYTTKTGLKIGCMYQPKPSYTVSRDMERLQTSLLAQSQPSMMYRIKTYINDLIRTDV